MMQPSDRHNEIERERLENEIAAREREDAIEHDRQEAEQLEAEAEALEERERALTAQSEAQRLQDAATARKAACRKRLTTTTTRRAPVTMYAWLRRRPSARGAPTRLNAGSTAARAGAPVSPSTTRPGRHLRSTTTAACAPTA